MVMFETFVIAITQNLTSTTTLQPFYGSLAFVRDNPGKPVPER